MVAFWSHCYNIVELGAHHKQPNHTAQSGKPTDGTQGGLVNHVGIPVGKPQYQKVNGQQIDPELGSACQVRHNDGANKSGQGFEGIHLRPVGAGSPAFQFSQPTAGFVVVEPPLAGFGNAGEHVRQQNGDQNAPITDSHDFPLIYVDLVDIGLVGFETRD